MKILRPFLLLFHITVAIGRHGHLFQNRYKSIICEEELYVLKWFGRKKGEAKRDNRQFVKKGIAIGRRPELVGGCLIKSQGGCSAVKAMHRIELVKDVPYIAYILTKRELLVAGGEEERQGGSYSNMKV